MKKRARNPWVVGWSRVLRRAIPAVKGGGSQVPCDPEYLHALAERLARIADGENAAHVLFQKRMGRPRSKVANHFPIAETYSDAWLKALPGETRRTEALRAVRARHPGCKLADSTVHRVCWEIGSKYGLRDPSRATPDEFEDLTKK